MKKDLLEDAIGNVEESLLNDADEMRSGAYKKRISAQNRARRRRRMGSLLATAACICLVATAMLQSGMLGSLGGSKLASISSDGVMEEAAMDQAAEDNVYGGQNSKDEELPMEEAAFIEKSVTARALGEADLPQFYENPNVISQEEDVNDAYENWRENCEKRRKAGSKINGRLDAFGQRTIKEYLKNAGRNVAYSPVNLWMALAMLAESTGADSRQQILDLLEVKDTEELQKLVQHVWKATERDDGVSTTLLANSLWMSDQMSYLEQGVKTLKNQYHASTFMGEMGSDAYNDLLHQWLDDHTRGLLTEQANAQSLGEDTMMALASAIYFKDKWSECFNVDMTSQQTFHGLDGDVSCDFLHGIRSCTYYEEEQFAALLLPFEGNKGMWIVLPKEGYTVDQVMGNETAMKILNGEWKEADGRIVQAELALPKFDITSDVDLTMGLINLGVSDIFDPAKADFAGILGGEAAAGAAINDAVQAARVKIDEEGCEAAAFTTFKFAAEMLEERMEFTVDRPFLFSIVSDCQLPLFTGVVNNPE